MTHVNEISQFYDDTCTVSVCFTASRHQIICSSIVYIKCHYNIIKSTACRGSLQKPLNLSLLNEDVCRVLNDIVEKLKLKIKPKMNLVIGRDFLMYLHGFFNFFRSTHVH